MSCLPNVIFYVNSSFLDNNLKHFEYFVRQEHKIWHQLRAHQQLSKIGPHVANYGQD